MINTIYNELQKYKGEKVDIIINEGRSKIRNEMGIIKELYDNVFIILINGINESFSYSDIITKSVIIRRK